MAPEGPPSGRQCFVWLRTAVLALTLAAGLACLGTATPARADYTDAMSAEKAEIRHRLLRRSGWRENDFMSQAELCRYYSDGDSQTADPIEAYVWCFLASNNLALQGVTDAAVKRFLDDTFVTGFKKRVEVFKRLSNRQRSEAAARIVYAMSCTGASGLVRLGELYDPHLHYDGDDYFDTQATYDTRRNTRQRGNETFAARDGNVFDLRKAAREGLNTIEDPGQGRLPAYTEGRERVQDTDTPYGAYDDKLGNALERNTLEAMIYYTLAHREGHPYALQLRLELEQYLTDERYTYRMSDTELGSLRERAIKLANEWVRPFELYANGAEGADGRYSDECPITGRWQEALNRIDEINIRDIQFALRRLRFYQAEIDNQYGPMTRAAIKAFQTRNYWPASGFLSPYQTTVLIRLAALGGDVHSQNALGYMYGCGIGVPPDELMARRWYREAYDEGSALAAYNLGLLLQVEEATDSCLNGVEARRVDDDQKLSDDYFLEAWRLGFRSMSDKVKKRLGLGL